MTRNDVSPGGVAPAGREMSWSEEEMKYVAALVVPPLALLMIGKPGHFVVNACLCILTIPLTLMFGVFALLWLACIVHAFGMCLEHDTANHDRLARENGDMEIVPRH